MPPAATSPSSNLHDPSSSAYKKAKRLYLKTTRNRGDHVDADWTPFRAAEKKYKSRFPPPDLSQVLDLALVDDLRADEITRGGWKGNSNAVECREIRLRNDDQGRRGYIFPSIPGLVLLPSYLSHRDQRKLVRWALDDHARSPNETNLDTHYIIPEDGIWKKHLRSQKHSENRNADIQPRISTVLPNATSHSSQSDFGPRQLISNEAASPNNYVQLVSAPKPPSSPSLTVKPASATELVPKLRWANIGWYYHWGIKQYDFSRGKITVNETIKTICQEAVSNIRWDEVFDGTGREGSWGEDLDWTSWDKTYEPDAGIVNFYQIKDTLMAHVDRSEVSATSPLVSISLGCAAVFLIGGQSREVEPIPILLRSGDVVIMSGPQCRRAYHGVPRILDGTLPPHFERSQEDEDDPDDWDAYEEYLRTTRININVRQVFPKGFDPNLDGT